MQTLACDSTPPSLSLVPQRKRGRKKGKRKCPINSVTLVGFVGSDPEQRKAKGNGSKFTVLSVVTQRSWKNANDEWSSKTDWHRICIFRPRLAEHVAATIKKGAHVLQAHRNESSKHVYLLWFTACRLKVVSQTSLRAGPEYLAVPGAGEGELPEAGKRFTSAEWGGTTYHPSADLAR
jgi:hypothetical protein